MMNADIRYAAAGNRGARSARERVPRPEAKSESLITPEIYHAYRDALLAGRRSECARIVQQLLDSEIEIRDLYLDLFQTAMYEIGDLWERNRVSVATEHLATTITESLMLLVYPSLFSRQHIGRKAIIACVANEYHQIGAKMVADIFEIHGWDAYFLGANTPVGGLLEMIGEKQPDTVGLSLSLYFNLRQLTELIGAVENAYPHQAIVVGGQAFRHGGGEALQARANVTVATSLDTLERYIDSMS